MILLDTTILAYAVGGAHPLAGPCRTIVDAIGDGRLRATTTIEVVGEFAHVHARRGRRDDATRQALAYVRLLSPLLDVEVGDLEAGLHLFASHPLLGAFDSILAAVALRREVDALISADAGFASVAGLRHVSPADALALGSLLR